MFKLVLISFCFMIAPIDAQKAWYPYPVEVWDTPFDMESSRTKTKYVPLEKASKKWDIRVFFPHMKDVYWLAVNYGISDEVRRLGTRMTLQHAGGYEHLDVQIQQIRASLQADPKPDGIIIASVSLTGLDSVISEIRAQGIPVVDLINGVSSKEISAKAMVSYGDMGYLAGHYLAKKHPQNSAPVKVAWFPGPEIAGWVQAGDAGFKRGIENSAVDIVTTQYGDTGKMVQRKLVGNVLDTFSDIDYVVGTTVTAEAAPRLLRRKKLTDKIKILSYYLSPGVYQGIKRGQIIGAPVDPAVIQGRIAVDQMVRILEKKEYFKHVGPTIQVIDANNVGSFDRSTSLAPDGFRATYNVN